MGLTGELHKLKTVEQRDTEPWYFGYLFQGCVILGMAPILLPLIVAQKAGPANVGMVVAAFYVGQLLSPGLGQYAEKSRRFALVYMAGYVLIALGAIGFVLSGVTPLWLAFAFVMGVGAGASNTVSYSYIVEFKPREEWDARLGWLQTFYGTGQAIGLLVASIIQSEAGWGMWLAAALMVPGFLLGRVGLPKAKNTASDPPASPRKDAPTHHVPAHPPARTPMSIIHHYEHLSFEKLAAAKTAWVSFFGLFLVSWFLLMVGTWVIYNLYPLLMKQTYQIQPGLSSLYYAISAGIGVFFYAPSGTWSQKFGSRWVVLVGAVMTLISIGGMALLVVAPVTLQHWVVPPIFIILPVAWSPLIVAGTALAGELTTIPQGTAMGLFNACTALASVLAAVLAGWVAQLFDYGATCYVAAVITVASLLLFAPILFRRHKAQDAENPENESTN